MGCDRLLFHEQYMFLERKLSIQIIKIIKTNILKNMHILGKFCNRLSFVLLYDNRYHYFSVLHTKG
jgi:hypothetical protein